jgi:broad specificity phosphatase PhoE
MRLLLLRHAETLWTLSGQHTGRTDLELTQAGCEAARRASVLVQRVLGESALHAVYSSPRRRALQTADLALASEPILTDLLAEFDYGEYEGLTPAQIQARTPGWNLWRDGCPGGETVEQVGARVDRFIELVKARHADHCVCAVSHGHLIRVLTARLLGLEPREGRIFGIQTASLAELVNRGDGFVLLQWNLTA